MRGQGERGDDVSAAKDHGDEITNDRLIGIPAKSLQTDGQRRRHLPLPDTCHRYLDFQ